MYFGVSEIILRHRCSLRVFENDSKKITRVSVEIHSSKINPIFFGQQHECINKLFIIISVCNFFYTTIYQPQISKMKLSVTLSLIVAAATTYSASAFASRSVERASSVSLQSTRRNDRESDNIAKTFANAVLISMFSLSIFSAGPLPAFADGQTEKFKLPPVDLKDKDRCKLTSSSIGQANAARDKLYDLRMCNLSGQKAVGYDLSGVIMTETDVSKVNFQDAYFSKAYLHGMEE